MKLGWTGLFVVFFTVCLHGKEFFPLDLLGGSECEFECVGGRIEGGANFCNCEESVQEVNIQENKLSIGIAPFTTSGIDQSVANALYQIVTEVFTQSNRFIIVERSNMEKLIDLEKDRQMGYDYMASDYVIEQGRAIGATYLLFGHVNTYSNNKKKNVDPATGEVSYSYLCAISLTLRIINVETEEVLLAETIETITGFSVVNEIIHSSSTPEAAIQSAYNKIEAKTKKLIKKAFPLTFQIVGIESEKKGKVATVLISGGKKLGLNKGDKLVVFELSEISIDGRNLKREKEVSKLVVQEIQGDNFSLCKVLSNRELLKEKIENNAPLICRTSAK